ncbi:MAG: ABC transporter ATP-binding protein [Pseudomonadota bacterium]|nr:MAG: ABC transporter ATP-binding protein [Pseudomonadota bacterium]
MSALLEVRGLTRAFLEGERKRVVLQGVDLDVEAGSCVALLGRSGSGKSTVLNLIGGIDRPDAGQVRIADTDVTALSERERTLFRRRHIGFVYQAYNLIPTLTVEENLLLPLELNARPPDQAKDTVADLLAAVGLADRAAAFPDRLSGGEQQRVAIARALVHEPMLVLADEPTGTLDADTGRQVLALFDRLLRARGKTLLLVTHSREVTRLADRVLTLEDGHLHSRAKEVVW